MRPILFQFGSFRFYSFGLMAALALIVPGVTIVRPLVRRRGVPPEFAYELIIAAGVGGFVFARIYYLIENYASIKADFWHVAFGGAGFVWYGGLIGGFLGVVGWTLIRRYSLDIIANAMAPATAFGYLIGRIGCQLAGDGDYGKPSDLPWAMGYPHGTVPTPPGVTVHPTPIYEVIIMALRGVGPVAAGHPLRQVRLVDVRLVPGALGDRAVLHRVPAHQPGLVLAPHAAAVGEHRERADRRRADPGVQQEARRGDQRRGASGAPATRRAARAS